MYVMGFFPAFYIFVESFAEGRTAYLSHGFCKYFRGCSGDFRDEYLCFGKTEGHASQYKIHKEKRRFYICVLAQRKIAVWVAKKPDIFGLFAGDIFFVSTLWYGQQDLNLHAGGVRS